MEPYKTTEEWNEMNGKFEALRIAILTLIATQPREVVADFKDSYPTNVDDWLGCAIALPLKDIWFTSLKQTAALLSQTLKKTEGHD